MAEVAYGTSDDTAYPPVNLPSFDLEPQPTVPHITIGVRPELQQPPAQGPPVNLVPVEHKPEFETKLKLIPVEHKPDFIEPDTGHNAQESPETLSIQQEHLTRGTRPVQMFPAGTSELPLPAGMSRTANERGAFHYDPAKITEPQILDLSRQGRENEFLGLGPVNKGEVEARVARGERPLAITEYTPDGTEVRSAAGTHKTAKVQQQFFEQTKQDPNNIIAVGPPPTRLPSFGFEPTPEQNQIANRLLQAVANVFLGAPMADKEGKPLPPSYGLPQQAYEAVRTPFDLLKAPPAEQMPQTGTWTDVQEAQRQINEQATREQAAQFGIGTSLQTAGVSMPFAVPGAAGIFGGRLTQSVRNGGPVRENYYKAQSIDKLYGDPAKLQQLSQETGKTIPALIGELRQFIWDETGLFKGIDGKWRHEIPDIGASIRPDYPIDTPHKTTMGKLLDHPELYREYPELARTPVEIVPNTGQQWTARRWHNGKIDIVEQKKTPKNFAEVRLSALHELQHNVQGIEEFAGALSPDQIVPLAKTMVSQRQRPALARLEQLAAEAQKWADNNPGMTGQDFFDRFPAVAKEMYELHDIVTAHPRAVDRATIEVYHKLAGEAEAFNVEDRSHLDEPIRQITHPDYTLRYPREELIPVPNLPRLVLQMKPRAEPAPPLYSAVAKTIDESKLTKAPAAQWYATLRNAPGVKPEEMKWLGLEDWLREQKGPVTKEQIADYVRANQIEVKEVVKGEPTTQEQINARQDRITQQLQEARRARDAGLDPDNPSAGWSFGKITAGNGETFWQYKGPGIGSGWYNTREEAISHMQRDWGSRIHSQISELEEKLDYPPAVGQPRTATKFGSYTLPGGENYREMLLTLPGKEGAPTFTTSHFPDEPNVLAHIRFNDRTIDGKKTLFVEEVQSDWHQKGKREGYTGEQRQYWVKNNKSGNISDLFASKADAEAYHAKLPESIRAQTTIESAVKHNSGVPDAPFKTTWPDLAMKRIIRYAAENGYAKVAWTPGDVQAARYDLSQHLDNVTVVHTGVIGDERRWHVSTKGGSELGSILTDEKGTIINAASDLGDIKGKNIADVLGKDIAEKGMAVTKESRSRELTGLDLKVGGEGMKGFYDQILPASVNKLVKKYGAKVEMATGQQELAKANPNPDRYDHYYVDLPNGDRDGPYSSLRNAEESAKNINSEPSKGTVHSFDIPERLRQTAVEQGMPMFRQKGGAGVGPPKVPGRDNLTNPLPTPEDLPNKLRRRAARGPDVGAPKNEAFELPDGQHVGKVNLDQWIARTEANLTPKEIAEARQWYRDALKVYEQYFGKDKAPAMLGAWLTANVNATPSFAQLSAVRTLEQYKNKTGAFSPQKQGGLAHEKLMQYWDAIMSNDLSKLGEGGSGQKIYDFIDSALLKNTRTYYGDAPSAGAPAVADVHSLRDMGFVDQALLNWVEQKYGKETMEKLQRDSEGLSPGEAQYEWTADKMRSFTDELNKRGYAGGNWEPHELQAVGWTAMSKMLGRKAETSSAAIEANIRNLSYELDFGAGAPYHQQFAEWNGLSGEQKAQVTREVMPQILDFAKTVTGAHEFARVEGTGGWHEFTNPSFKSRLIASPEVAGDVADIVGYLAQQTKIMGYRATPSGPKLGIAIYGDALKDSATTAKLWGLLLERHPDFAAGFSPSINASGVHGMEILLDKGGAKMATRLEKELVPALDNIAKELGIDVDVHDFRSEELSREHDWTKDPEGRSYLQRLTARYGPDIQKRLELFKRKKLEPALRQSIERADPSVKGSAAKEPAANPEPVTQPVTRADELSRLGNPRASTSPSDF